MHSWETKLDGNQTVFSARLDDASLEQLRMFPLVQQVLLAHPFSVLRQPARVPSQSKLPPEMRFAQSSARNASIESSLIVIIDDGCPFAHHELRSDDGLLTRVEAIWDQDDEPDFEGLWQQPATVPYGAVVEKCDLDACIQASSTPTTVDESRCYKLAGYSAVSHVASHGSSILGWSASNSALREVEKKPSVLFVQLPRAVAMKPSFGSLSRCILDGVQWALTRRGERRRIVVCVAYDSWLGPHDGSSIFERAIDCLVDRCEKGGITLSLVFPMGNNYHAGTHAEIRLIESKGVATLRVLPDNEYCTHVEIWSNSDLAAARVKVTPPKGGVLQVRSSATPQISSNAFATLVANTKARGENYVSLLEISPTHRFAENPSPVGDWLVEVDMGEEIEGTVHAYVGRTTSGLTYPKRGTQSYFFPKWSAESDGSVNGLVCGQGSKAVGALQKWSGGPTTYSASGPARGGIRTTPDYSAVSEVTPSQGGLVAMGNYGGATMRFVGTSAATAKCTAWLAVPPPQDQTITVDPRTNRIGRRID
jgi:hypothetical protein